LIELKLIFFLNELKINFLHLSSINNIEDLYHNFTTTLSYFINKFSIEVSSNKRNRKTNPWYDKDCKSVMKEIKESFDDSLKTNKIKIYTALTKRKKCSIFVEDKKIYYTSLMCLLRNFGSKF